MDIRDIYRALRPLKNRMHINNAVRCVFISLAAASGAFLILSLAALFTPVPFFWRVVLYIYLAALLLASILSLLLRPGNINVMKTGDSLGLKERLITAQQLKDDASPIAEIQRHDALKAAASLDYKRLYPLKFPKLEAMTALMLTVLAIGLFLVPSGTKEDAIRMENIRAEIEEQAKRLEEEKEELKKKQGLSEEKLKEIDKKLSELLKELKKSDNESEAIKAISMMRHELDKLKNRAIPEEMKKLADSLSKNPITRELGDALKNGLMEDIKQKLEKLNEDINKLDAKERENLADELKKAAEELAENKELAQALAGLSQAVASGNPNSVRDGMTALGNSLSGLASSGESSMDGQEGLENVTLDQILASLDEARREIADTAGSGYRFAQGNEGQQSNSVGSGQGGKGQGNNNGQGGGQSGKGAGGGAGEGSTNKDAGYKEGESGNAGRRPGEKQVRDYEQVYVPDRLGDGGEVSQVKGTKTKSGQSQWSEVGNVPVEKGYTVPYNEVLAEYRKEAMDSISEAPVPPVMKDIVREYFTSLE